MQLSVRLTSEVLVPLSPPDYLEWFDLSSRPLLDLARKSAKPAHSVRIEWLVDRLDGPPRLRRLTNYQQILRQPFSPRGGQSFEDAAQEAGERILDDAERTLWYGRPTYGLGGLPLSTCGGVLHYLRRRLYENDRVCLRELQPLMLRRFEDFKYVGEWLWEFSLQVNPGHYERGMKPVALPPKAAPVKAWEQGSDLL